MTGLGTMLTMTIFLVGLTRSHGVDDDGATDTSADSTTDTSVLFQILKTIGLGTLIIGIATLLTGRSLLGLFVGNKNKSSADGVKGQKLPMAPIGIFKIIQTMGSINAPTDLLKLAKFIMKNSSTSQSSSSPSSQPPPPTYCFRVPLAATLDGAYIIGDADLARAIYVDKKTIKPRRIYKRFEGTNKKTVFSSADDEKYTKQIRKAAFHAFTRKEINRIKTVARSQVKRWINTRLEPVFVKQNKPFDPAEEMNRITFFIICHAAFEYECTDAEYEKFASNIEFALRHVGLKAIFNPLKSMFGSFIPSVRKARKLILENRNLLGRMLQQYRDKKTQREEAAGGKQKNDSSMYGETLISILNDLSCIESDFQLVSEMNVWLFAGHDTTGNTLSNAMTLLAQHPTKQEKCHRAMMESINAAKNHDDNTSFGNAETSCTYLKNVIRETQRLIPVAALGPTRQIGRDFYFATEAPNDISAMPTTATKTTGTTPSADATVEKGEDIDCTATSERRTSSSEKLRRNSAFFDKPPPLPLSTVSSESSTKQSSTTLWSIPKGSYCMLNQYLMNRNPDVYDRPDEFIPERWDEKIVISKTSTTSENTKENEEKKDGKEISFEEKQQKQQQQEGEAIYRLDASKILHPFALGNRNCPGQALAVSEINTVLAELLRHYRLELVQDGILENFLTFKYTGSLILAHPR